MSIFYYLMGFSLGCIVGKSSGTKRVMPGLNECKRNLAL